MSVGPDGSGFDVITTDTIYEDWARDTGAQYVVVRPDFYVAATATSTQQLAACLDTIMSRLRITAEDAAGHLLKSFVRSD